MGEFMHRLAEELRTNEQRLEDHWARRNVLEDPLVSNLEKLLSEVRELRANFRRAFDKCEKRAEVRVDGIEKEAGHLAKRVESFVERLG